MNIAVSSELSCISPDLKLNCMIFELCGVVGSVELNALFEAEKEAVLERFKGTSISALNTIAAARKVYRLLGKDPTRYRVSSESLLRRVHLNKGLDAVSPVVDCVNIASMRYGLSIGAYDLNTLRGDLVFGIGEAFEIYNAVGRGALNIEGLPVLRDDIGAFGSSTTDSERAKVTDSTTQILLNVIAFDGQMLEETTSLLRELIETYANGTLLKPKDCTGTICCMNI